MDEKEFISTQPKAHHRHFHAGALFLAMGLIFLLFKVNIEKVVNDPQFDKNVNYIEAKITLAWRNHITTPFKSFLANIFTLKPITKDTADDTFNRTVKPDKINSYFGNTSDETVNQLSSPVGN